MRTQVESEEVVNEARLRALFPDYHSSFNDIVEDGDGAAADVEATCDANVGQDDGDRDNAKALGLLSDNQLSLLVARHARIFLSLAARQRQAVRTISKALVGVGGSSSSRVPVEEHFTVSDAARLVAFGDSYRASVLLVDSTSSVSAVVVGNQSSRYRKVGDDVGVVATQGSVGDAEGGAPVLHLEEAFVTSHILALADASSLCKSGRRLLDDAAEHVSKGPPDAANKVVRKKAGNFGKSRGSAATAASACAGPAWREEGAAGRSLLLVGSFVNFHLDPNVGETRLADGPLAGVLRRVAALLSEFPGHGVLIQVRVNS